MKIQIDFSNKIIWLQETVTLKEFNDKVKQMLPNGEWKEYSLVIDNNPVKQSEVVHYSMWYTVPYWKLLPETLSDDSDEWFKLNVNELNSVLSLDVR